MRGSGNSHRRQRLRAPLPTALFARLLPIEEAFAKLKALLRKAEARSREVLIEAMGRALEKLTARDARGFLEHRGYRALGQLL